MKTKLTRIFAIAALALVAATVSAIPAEYRAEAIIDAIGHSQIAGKRFLIPRAQAAREVLPLMLLEKGATEVVVAPAYQTIVPHNADVERVRGFLSAGAVGHHQAKR